MEIRGKVFVFSISVACCVVLVAASLGFAKDISAAKDAAINAVRVTRDGLENILVFVDDHPEIFLPPEKPNSKMISAEKRVVVRETWQSLLDHIFLLDSIGHRYSEQYFLAKSRRQAADYFFISFAAFLTEYRYALDFIERIERHPPLDVILNDPVPEFGLAPASYAAFKFRFLNILRGAEFARLQVLYTFYENISENPFASQIEEDTELLWKAGRGKGTRMTAENVLDVISDLGFTAWFPVQKSVASIMGNIKVWRPGSSLVNRDQIDSLGKKLEPGDILLERREWYTSNLGIPGFWTHAALYIGTPEERASYFSDQSSKEWLMQQDQDVADLEELLQQRYPEKYQKSVTIIDGGKPGRVVEAIEDGVSFTSLEHAATVDSIAVLRPKLPKSVKSQAILRGFHYSGRPYDFNFDFRTDSELVCSELIYKAYEPSSAGSGLSLPLTEMMGRPILSPNTIARLFAEEYGSGASQFELVAFLDGHEYQGKAVNTGLATFLTSWKRPKYHILLPDVGPR